MVGIMVRLLIIMFMELISAAHASDQRLLGPDDVVVGRVVKRCGSPTPPPAPTTWEELESSLNALMVTSFGMADPNGISLFVNNLKMIESVYALNSIPPLSPFAQKMNLSLSVLEKQFEFIATTWPINGSGGWNFWQGGNDEDYEPYPLIADFIKSRSNVVVSKDWDEFLIHMDSILPPPNIPGGKQLGWATTHLLVDTLWSIEQAYTPEHDNISRASLANVYQKQLAFIASTWPNDAVIGWYIWTLSYSGESPVPIYPSVHAFLKSRYERKIPPMLAARSNAGVFDLGETTEDNCCSRFFWW